MVKGSLTILVLFLIASTCASSRGIQTYNYNRGVRHIIAETTENVTVIRVLNTTEIYEGEAVKIYTIIDNPGTWVLYNISCFLVLRPFVGVDVVDYLNESGVTTEYETRGEEYCNFSISIKRINMSSKFIHWITLRFNKNGTYKIESSIITFTQVKGEIIAETKIEVNGARIEVRKKPRPYPPEGAICGYPIAIGITILLPLVCIFLLGRFIRKSRWE